MIDLSRVNIEVKGYFKDYLEDFDTFFLYLQSTYQVKLQPRNSVIIFDEVQIFPRAREEIKPLVADGRFDYLKDVSRDGNRHLLPFYMAPLIG